MPIVYHGLQPSDLGPFLKMAQKLWPHFDEGELGQFLNHSLSKKQMVFIARGPAGTYVGFSIFSIRTDYVEGACQSPTGYLEGVFVEPAYRKMGIAREFVRLGEGWCRENGCAQMGSDTWLTAKEAREFHKSIGFWEEDELVHFLKNLD